MWEWLCPLRYLVCERLGIAIKPLLLILQSCQAMQKWCLYFWLFCGGRRRRTMQKPFLAHEASGYLSPGSWLLWDGHSWHLLVHSFMPWNLSAACLYGCFSLHDYSISCYAVPWLHCPPCWSPMWSLHSLKRVLHCNLCITALKFHISIVIPLFMQWAWWKKGHSTC